MTNEREDGNSAGQGLAFNMAMPYLIRVDILLSKVSEYAIKEEYRMMKHTLRALYRELSPYISKLTRVKIKKHFKAIKHNEDLRWKYERTESENDYNGGLTQKQLMIRQNFHNNKVIKLLELMSERLLSQVHLLGLLIPKKKDKTFIGGEY